MLELRVSRAPNTRHPVALSTYYLQFFHDRGLHDQIRTCNQSSFTLTSSNSNVAVLFNLYPIKGPSSQGFFIYFILLIFSRLLNLFWGFWTPGARTAPTLEGSYLPLGSTPAKICLLVFFKRWVFYFYFFYLMKYA